MLWNAVTELPYSVPILCINSVRLPGAISGDWKQWKIIGCLLVGHSCSLVLICKLSTNVKWFRSLLCRAKNMLVRLRLRTGKSKVAFRLGNPDLDHKTWIFRFTIEQKIWNQISSRVTIIGNRFNNNNNNNNNNNYYYYYYEKK